MPIPTDHALSPSGSQGVPDLGFGRKTVLLHIDERFEKRWGLSSGAAERLRRQVKERPGLSRPITDGLGRQPGNRVSSKRILLGVLLMRADRHLWNSRLYAFAW